MYQRVAPLDNLPKDSSSWEGLDPVMAARVERVFESAKAAGLKPKYVSGFRPAVYQQEMKQSYGAGNTSGIQAQPASRSSHTMGFAVDIQIGKPDQMLELVKIVHDEGLAFTVDGDPNHIEIVGPPGPYKNEVGMTIRDLLENSLPKELVRCSDCVVRRYQNRSDASVAARLEREYRVRAEVREFLERSRKEMELARSRFEKPDFQRADRSERSFFGNDYRFDNPYGGTDSDMDEEDASHVFGDWRFDEVDSGTSEAKVETLP